MCTCVRVNSMCSKLEGIFKHIGLTTWTHAYVCMECHGILIPKNKKMMRKTGNLGSCNVIPTRRCGKEIGMFDERLDTHPSQTGATRQKVRGSERDKCMFDDEREIASSYGLQFFSTSNVHYYNCNVKFWKILGVILPF